MTIKVKPLEGTGRTLAEWKEFARRDDCLDRMVPSDLCSILSAIEEGGDASDQGNSDPRHDTSPGVTAGAVDPAAIRAEALREAAKECATLAALHANIALTGLPAQARLREAMEASFTKAAYAILALIDKEQDHGR